MSTTSDRNTLHKGIPQKRTVRCGVGTYLKGVPVMMGENDDTVKPLTGSAAIAAHAVGVSAEHKTVTTHGVEFLTVDTEAVFFFDNAAGAGEIKNRHVGKVAFFTDNTTVSITDSGDDVVGGRIDHIDTQLSASTAVPQAGVYMSMRGPRSGSV
jgi:hypothetical protein